MAVEGDEQNLIKSPKGLQASDNQTENVTKNKNSDGQELMEPFQPHCKYPVLH